MNQKRYVVTADFYLWADSDDNAIKGATMMVERMLDKDDNRPKVLSVIELPFGALECRLVYPQDDDKVFDHVVEVMDEEKKARAEYEADDTEYERKLRLIEPADKNSPEWDHWAQIFAKDRPKHPDVKKESDE